ncbi:MAG: hypothetical protein GY701_08065 [Sulfitobacter sp.]|nr:hypothetical protein [Sulfitobacter sp.]
MRKKPLRRTKSGQVSLPAPVAGLVEGYPSADGGAEVLENFLPTSRGVKVRGGTSQFAYIRQPVASMFGYVAGAQSKVFAASASAIFDVTTTLSSASSPNSSALTWGQGKWGVGTWSKVETPIASGLTSGAWSAQQIGTSGGDFLIAVNGADTAQIYDGTDLNPLSDVAVNNLSFDAMTAAISIGEVVTGGTSGASATVLGLVQLTGSTGTLKLGPVTGGPFLDNEAISSPGGAAFADGVNSAASSITITGVDTSDLSHVWIYRDRMFFVKKDSLKAYYLPVASIGGAALDVSLAGVFQRGGKLLLGATWSLDSGDGMDDKCVFVSDRGEVAIYSGSDPSDVNAWSFEGRYDIGKPLGKNATMRVGGDLLIATDEGLVPLSAALQRDPAELSLRAATRPIERTWRDEVSRASSDVQLVKWTYGDLMLAVFPQADRMLTANLNTAAWAVQTGWHGTCGATFGDRVYVGRADGFVMELDTGGTDDGAAFTARLCYSFQEMGNPAAYKRASMIRGAFYADDAFTAKYSVASDFSIDWPAAPNASASTRGAIVWGQSAWGSGAWSKDIETPRNGVTERWSSVAGTGFALAPMLQITSGGGSRLPVELIRVDFLAESGGRVV